MTGVLADCVQQAERCGITILFEPLNRADHPRCAIARCAEALAVIEEIDDESLFLLYDFYHGHLMGDAPQDVLKGSGWPCWQDLASEDFSSLSVR